jgi:NTP pyrophosphatase (non-canonical NTP hydrolase)
MMPSTEIRAVVSGRQVVQAIRDLINDSEGFRAESWSAWDAETLIRAGKLILEGLQGEGSGVTTSIDMHRSMARADGPTLDWLQARHAKWARANFPDEMPRDVFLGVVEEVGEWSHAILKSHQGIRGTAAEHEAAERDAIGDVLQYVMHYCDLRGWSLADIVLATMDHVHKRDWSANRLDGSVPAPAASAPEGMTQG